MFKFNIFILIVAIFCLNKSANALSTLSRNKVTSNAQDLELTRKLIMAHIDKIESSTKGVDMVVPEPIKVAESASSSPSPSSRTRRKKKNLVTSVKKNLKSAASTAASVPKTFVKAVAIDPIKNSVDKVNSIKKNMTGRKNRRSGSEESASYAPVSFVGRFDMFDVRNQVTIKSVEKKSRTLVSMITRIASLGQVEVLFE